MDGENLAEVYVIEIKIVSYSLVAGQRKNSGAKNEDKFHYVIENKCRQIVRFRARNYVIENMLVMAFLPLSY